MAENPMKNPYTHQKKDNIATSLSQSSGSLKKKSNTAFLEYLSNHNYVKEDSYQILISYCQQSSGSIAHYILKNGILNAEDLADYYKDYCDLPITSFSDLQITPEILDECAPRFCRQHRLLPLFRQDNYIAVACFDPLYEEGFSMMEAVFNAPVKPVLCLQSDIHQLLDQYIPDENIAPSSDAPQKNLTHTLQNDDDAPAIRLVEIMIDRAVLLKASDIHLESNESGLTCRFRIDGELHLQTLPKIATPDSVFSRLKLQASLDIAEKRLPQDGRARIISGGREIDLRLATMPTIGGESLTIRLLHKTQIQLNLEKLGFAIDQLSNFRKLMNMPYGLILVTGPTGSGKTTTLYAALHEKIDGQRKIMSIEDPVEYHLSGVTQTQVNASIGLDFPRVLRSVLRHDPDIILVGEIRDKETADIAIQAALTGHLVLATLHTNSACQAITRLMDMGVQDYLISAALRGVLAQRLVRKLAQQDQISSQAPESSKVDPLKYEGRLVVSELLTISDPLRALIHQNNDSLAIEKCAIQGGMKTMTMDAQEKVKKGLTSEQEYYRITLEQNLG